MQSVLFLSKMRERGAFADHAQEVLRNPDVQEAQRLLRAGLLKPVKLLDESDAADAESFLAAQAEAERYPQIRILTALCAAENAAALKEGRFEDSIGALKRALQLREAVQNKSLASWKVGSGALGVVTRSVNNALPASSALQCSQYRLLLEPLLAAPSSLLPALESEERRIQSEIRALERGAEGRKEAMELLRKRDPKLAKEVQSHLKKNSEDVHEFVEQATASVEVYFTNLRSGLFRPAPQREKALFPDKETPLGKYLRLVVPDYAPFLALHDQDVLNLRIALLHAHIRQYKAETGMFPESLEELPLVRLKTDPFTGKPFAYQKTKDSFTLAPPKP